MDRLLDRCLKNRKGELLDALRSIMAGEIPTAAARAVPSKKALFLEFVEDAKRRFENLTSHLGGSDPARTPHGCIDIAFWVDEGFGEPTLADLNRAIIAAFKNHSGWPPFVALSREDIGPHPVDGAIEAWLGNRGSPAHHSDYWRIDPRGFLFTRMGLREDEARETRGTLFDINWTFLRVAEAILEVAYLSERLGVTDGNVHMNGVISGLKSRHLAALYSQRIVDDRYVSHTDRSAFSATVAVNAIEDALPEVVWSTMRSVYENFSLFELSKRMVEQEVGRLRKTEF